MVLASYFAGTVSVTGQCSGANHLRCNIFRRTVGDAAIVAIIHRLESLVDYQGRLYRVDSPVVTFDVRHQVTSSDELLNDVAKSSISGTPSDRA